MQESTSRQCFVGASRSLSLLTIVIACIFSVGAGAYTVHANDVAAIDGDTDSYAADLQSRWDDELANTPDVVTESTPNERILLAAAESQPAPVVATIGKAESKDDEPLRLHRAMRERDISVGYGRKIPTSRFEGRTNVTLFQVIPRWGRMRNSTMEFLWEVPIMYASDPESAYGAGITLMVRQHLSSSRRFNPFVEIGAGIMLTNLNDKIDELGGHFQFTPQAGVGFRTALGRNSDFVAALRWFHMSNAGLSSPNAGLNNYLVTAGYSRLF